MRVDRNLIARMYIPKVHEETDLATLHALIETYPLGIWVTQGAEGLVANHIPFLLDPTRGEQGTLIGHVARANTVWGEFCATTDSLAIFQGPQAYVTPSWYPSKHATGKAVPTWNYAVVHAYGRPRAIEDRDWLLACVTRLTDRHEAGQDAPWQVSDAPADFVDQLLGAIVGIEIRIARLEGKWKTSQNRPHADQRGVVAGLKQRGDGQAGDIAALVERQLSPD